METAATCSGTHNMSVMPGQADASACMDLVTFLGFFARFPIFPPIAYYARADSAALDQ